jgi:hypothetical protein
MVAPGALAMPELEPEIRQAFPAAPEGMIVQRSQWGLPEWFAVSQVAGPALLYLPGSQAFRAPLRIGAFALSLFGLIWCLRRSRVTRVHPAWILLVISGVYMAVMIFHPATNTTKAGLGQIGMHLAVAAPLFWAPHYFRGDYQRLARVLTILWILNGASVVVGILQVRDPATWMPAEFSVHITKAKGYLSALQYRAADGKITMRPPGLGDSPGAACFAGMFVATMGLAYLGLHVSRSRKLLAFIMGVAGVVVIFLSHNRSSLVVVVGCGVLYSIILVAQGRSRTALKLACWMAICGVCSVLYSGSVGGESTIDRFATLVSDHPLTVYEKSARLFMVTDAFDSLLVNHPLGAGLGRWGMMRTYFGDESNLESPLIWAEVQFQAWVLDGGFVVLSLYLIALTMAVQRLVRSSLIHPSLQLRRWGAVIFMLSIGPIALLFSYCPFNSQIGMQFWFLIGAFEGLAQGEEGHAVPGYQPEAGIRPSHDSADVPGSLNDVACLGPLGRRVREREARSEPAAAIGSDRASSSHNHATRLN